MWLRKYNSDIHPNRTHIKYVPEGYKTNEKHGQDGSIQSSKFPFLSGFDCAILFE